MPDELLLSHQGIGHIELLLKYIRRRNYKNKIKKILPNLKNDSDTTREILLKYVASVTDFSESEFLDLVESCVPKDKGVIMTLTQRWLERGREEGIEKGIEKGKKEGKQEGLNEVVRRMLFADMTEDSIQTATGLSTKSISKIRKA